MILLISCIVISSRQQDLSENPIKYEENYSNCVKEYNLCADAYNHCSKELERANVDIGLEKYREIGEFVGQGIGYGVNLVYNGW